MQRMYVDQCRLKLQDCAVPKIVEKRDCFMIYEWLHWKKWRKKKWNHKGYKAPFFNYLSSIPVSEVARQRHSRR